MKKKKTNITPINKKLILSSKSLPFPLTENKFSKLNTNSWFNFHRSNHELGDKLNNRTSCNIKTKNFVCRRLLLNLSKEQKTKILYIMERSRKIYNFSLQKFRHYLHKTKSENILYSILKSLNLTENKNHTTDQKKEEKLKLIVNQITKLKNKFKCELKFNSMEEYRKLLNETNINNINKKFTLISKLNNKIKREFNSVFWFKNNIKFRKYIKENLPEDLKINTESGYVSVYDNAIWDVLKSYKSAQALKQTGVIKHFRLRHKKINSPKKCCVIESKDFSSTGFYIRSLGTIKLNISHTNIKHTCRLTFQNNKFTLNVPIEKKIFKVKTNREEICGVDPGVKTFATIYSKSDCCEIGDNTNKISKTTEFITKGRSLLNSLRQKKNIDNFIISNKFLIKNVILDNRENQSDLIKDKLKQKSLINKLTKIVDKRQKKQTNRIRDLHYKTASILCKNYSKVLLGNMSTKSITTNKNNLPKITKRLCYSLAHYKFKTILQNMGEKYKTDIKIVDESYTSRTCGSCGEIKNNLNGNRTFICNKCPFVMGRDLNAARNILIKNQ